MSSIDFETDQAKVIHKTENIRSLADQVENLEQATLNVEATEEKFRTFIRRSNSNYDV